MPTCCDLSFSIQIPPACVRCCMFDPQNKWQAASIFLAGIVVIGWTVLDVHRTTRLNEQPMTPEQQKALTERVQAAEESHLQQTLQQLKRG